MLQHVMTSNTRDGLRRLGHDLAAKAAGLVVRLQEGQSMVEYAIIAALIAVIAMAAVQTLGTGIAGVFSRILSSIQGIG